MTVQDSPQAKQKALAQRLGRLLTGRSIAKILRADDQELVVELDDGSRLFARATKKGLDISVT
jgi:hypothetical protein